MVAKGPRSGSAVGVTGVLAGISILPEILWRLLPDLVYSLTGYLDTIAVGFMITQSVAGSSRIGLAVAWLLIGHLTYQYTWYLYPDEFQDVVDEWGFRALTVLGTLYFGVVCWGTIVSQAVPVQVLSAASLRESLEFSILAFLIGGICGVIVFGQYLLWWHTEKVRGDQSDLLTLWDWFFYEFNQYEGDLPVWWQIVYRWQRIAGAAALPVLVSILIGLVGVVLNLFYPIPEAALLIGLVAFHVWPDSGRLDERAPRHEVDQRLLDSASAATQNPKGMVMLLISFLGMTVSGSMFFIWFGVLLAAFGPIFRGDVIGSVVPLDWSGRLLFGVATLGLLMSGFYSLVHWVRQLERIEPYVRQWGEIEEEVDHIGQQEIGKEAADRGTDSPPARPPGLLVPSYLPLVGMIVVISPLTHFGYWWGPVILGGFLTAAVVAMSWGFLWIQRHESQSLADESRDLFLTILLQFVFMASLLLGSRNPSQIHMAEVLSSVLVLILLAYMYYIPDIYYWKSQQKGVRKILGEVPSVLFGLSAIGLVKLWFEGAFLIIGAFFTFIVISILSYFLR